MRADLADYERVRRAYELGRARAALRRAFYIVAPVGTIAAVVTGPRALAWLPMTAALWILAHWRGGPLLRGAFFGLVGGAITYVLPISVLRPCCSVANMTAGGDCCTMPGACVGAGAIVGFALAAFVPLGTARWRTAGGMAIGVASVAILRCSTLFAGEAIGLVGGVLAGVFAATMAHRVLGWRLAPQD